MQPKTELTLTQLDNTNFQLVQQKRITLCRALTENHPGKA